MRPQLWLRAMMDEIPLRNEIAWPIDFSSVATDKTFTPFDARTPAHNRTYQLRITAVSLPFGVVWNHPDRDDSVPCSARVSTKLAAIFAISR